MDKQTPTLHLDVRAFARSGGVLGGRSPLTAFSRVAKDCCGSLTDVDVQWNARGELRRDQAGQAQAWLHLQLKAELPLTCQRCLDRVLTPLHVDRLYRFVDDEKTAHEQDDDAAEDLLVLVADFNLHELVEDELVLALPLIARHDVCPIRPVLAVQDAGFEQPVDKPNPFAALAVLKAGTGGTSQ